MHKALASVYNTLISKRIHPPTIWRKIILDEVKIAYRGGEYIGYAPVSTASSHLTDFLGLAVPRFGRIIYPEVVKLPWGSATVKTVTTGSNATFYTTLEYGNDNTLTAYNATPDNQSNSCAVGYAHNFQRMVTDGTTKGIRAGSWYLMHPSEAAIVVFPIIEQLKYAASLLGFTNWPDVFWTSYDNVNSESKEKAYRLNLNTGNLLGSSKTSLYGALLMTKMQIGVSSPLS